MPGGPPPALPGDHTVMLGSIGSQTSIRKFIKYLFYLNYKILMN